MLIEEDLNKWKDAARFMDWEAQHNTDVNSP